MSAVEATAFLQESPEGWRIKLVFDDGQAVVTEQSYETPDLARAALINWCAEIGATSNSAQ